MGILGDYVRSGGYMAGGFEPTGGTGGAQYFTGYNMDLGWDKGTKHRLRAMAVRGMPKDLAGWGTVAGQGAGAAFSLYSVYQGYQEGGLSGAKDAAVWDLATASAISRFAYEGENALTGYALGPKAGSMMSRIRNAGAKPAGSVVKFGGAGGMGVGITRSLGAGIGASIGQAVAGTPGAYAGAYIGAAPIRFAATHPLLAGGLAAGAVAAAVGYGTYSVVKGGLQAGYAHSQRQKGIHTSGSMAAFMTAGATTMRSRSVQAIHKSHLNARSALGQEAGFMHMPGKNYHSRYR